MKKDTKKKETKNKKKRAKADAPSTAYVDTTPKNRGKKLSSEMRRDSIGVALAGGLFRIAAYVLVVVAIIYVGQGAYHFGYSIFNQEPMEYGEGTEITVVISEDSSSYQIGKILEEKGLIESAEVFVIQEKLANIEGGLLPGTYILNTTMVTDQILEILAGINTEGQPSEMIEEGEVDESADAVYDKVSEDVEAGDVEEGADEETGLMPSEESAESAEGEATEETQE